MDLRRGIYWREFLGEHLIPFNNFLGYDWACTKKEESSNANATCEYDNHVVVVSEEENNIVVDLEVNFDELNEDIEDYNNILDVAINIS